MEKNNSKGAKASGGNTLYYNERENNYKKQLNNFEVINQITLVARFIGGDFMLDMINLLWFVNISKNLKEEI